MILENLRLSSFKNYPVENFQFHPSFNILNGLNGMGKTNVLEAIHYLCLGKGYFTAQDKLCIGQGSDFFRIEGTFQDENGEKLLVVVKYGEGGRKQLEINGTSLERLSDHVGSIPCVIFAPEDVRNLLDTSESRRNFLNNTLVQYDKEYLQSLLVYTNLLKTRNAYFKQMTYLKSYDDLYLQSLQEKMERPAMIIYQKRQKLVEDLNQVFSEMYALIAGEKEHCTLVFTSQLEKSSPADLWRESIETDKVLGRTTCGVHKDDIRFIMNESEIKNYGSQGQLKSFVLSLKIAQYMILKRYRQKKPIVLLDDVFDKLDHERVKNLVRLLSRDEFGQVFISDTDEIRVSEILQKLDMQGRQFVISEGKVEKTESYEKA